VEEGCRSYVPGLYTRERHSGTTAVPGVSLRLSPPASAPRREERPVSLVDSSVQQGGGGGEIAISPVAVPSQARVEEELTTPTR
jgi:hypothetical protein